MEAATVTTLLTVSMRLGIGPLFLPIAQDLGFSRSLLSGIVAAGMLFVLLTGVVLVAVATVWSVTTRTPGCFLASFGVLISVCLAFTSPVALTPVISRWLNRRRGMALFVLSTGFMAGIAMMTPALGLALQCASWQTTLIGFAIVYTALTVPIALFFVRDQAPVAADLPDPPAAGTVAAPMPPVRDPLGIAQTMRTGTFIKITLGLFSCGFSMNLLDTHGMPMLMDHCLSATTSSVGIGLIGLVAIPSTLFLGRLADRVPRRKLQATIYLVCGQGFFALLSVQAPWELYAAAAIGGIVWAGSIALSSAFLANVYGVRLVGVRYGWGFEQFSSHRVAFGASGLLLLLAAGVSLRLPDRR